VTRLLPLLLLACVAPLTGPEAGDAYPEATEEALAVWESAVGPVSPACRELAESVHVVLLPRARTEELCRTMFGCGVGACIGLFSDGWRMYVAEDNISIERSVTHELGHLLGACEGHPLGLDHGHCGEFFAAQGHDCR